MSMANDYRAKIYEHYTNAAQANAPVSTIISGLDENRPYYCRIISRYFPANRSASILDLGCGFGALIRHSREAGYTNVSGVDISPVQVAIAKQLGIESVSEADISQTLSSLPGNAYDAIVMFDVVEHFRTEEIFDLAEDVFRALRKGGKWILRVPNAEAPFAARMRYGDLTHQQLFTPDSCVQLLTTAGFVRVACYEDTDTIHNLKSLLRATMFNAMKAWLHLWLSVETGGVARGAIFSQNFIGLGIKE